MGKKPVLADTGWAGEKRDFFTIPAVLPFCVRLSTIVGLRIFRFSATLLYLKRGYCL